MDFQASLSREKMQIIEKRGHSSDWFHRVPVPVQSIRFTKALLLSD